MKQTIAPILKALIQKANLAPLTPSQVDAFQSYFELLIEWNQRLNLTAITTPEEVCEKHFIDSLLLKPHLPEKPGIRIADIGTGAGFPGIPLAICRPDATFTLIDALNKRVSFLNALIQSLQLTNVQAIHGRSEDLAREDQHRDQYDVTVARAVARLPLLIEYTMPFIKTGGIFIGSKGTEGQTEIAESENALRALETELAQTIHTHLPSGDERQILIFRKIAPTPEKFPRRPGMAKKRPL